MRDEQYNNWSEKKKTLETINSRITEAEEWVSELEDRIVLCQKSLTQKRIKEKE